MNCVQRWIYWCKFVKPQQCHRHLIRQTYIGVVLSLSHIATISSSVKFNWKLCVLKA